MKNPIGRYIWGSIAILLPLYLYQSHVQWLGFPDGALTDLEQFQKDLFPVFRILSIGFWIGFLGLNRNLTTKNRKILQVLFVLYFLLLIALALIHSNIGAYFADGAGG